MTKVHFSCLKQVKSLKGQQLSISKQSLICFVEQCWNLSFQSTDRQDQFYNSLKQLIKQQTDTSTQKSQVRQSFSRQEISQIKQQKSSYSQLKYKSQIKSTSTLFPSLNSTSCIQIKEPQQSFLWLIKPQKQILSKVDKNSRLYRQIQHLLNRTNFTQQLWTELISELKKYQILLRNQNYQCLAQIVDQILGKDIMEIRSIKDLLNYARSDLLGDQFYKFTTEYLGKLNIIANTHYIVMNKVQNKIKAVHQLLQTALQQIKKQKTQCCKQIKIESLQILQICELNSLQIHKILFSSKKYHPSFQLKSSIRQILSFILSHLSKQTNRFKLSICHMSKKFPDINPSQIKLELGVIFRMLKFIRKIHKQISKKSEVQGFSQFIGGISKIQQIQKEAEQSILGIKVRINKIAKNQYVWHQNLNFVLLTCLTVLKQYQYYQLTYFIKSSSKDLNSIKQQQLKKPLQQISVQSQLKQPLLQISIQSQSQLKKPQIQIGIKQQGENPQIQINKIQYKNTLQLFCIQQQLKNPQLQMSKIQFKLNHYTFKRLLNSLQYLKRLDSQLIRLNELSQNFNFTIRFYNNQIIKSAVQKCLKSIRQKATQFEFLHQLMSCNKQLYYCDQAKKSQILEKKQKNFQEIKLQKLKQAVQFIKCFQQVKLIVKEFNNFYLIEQFLEHQFDKIDLKKAILQRIQQIKLLVNDQIQIKQLTKQEDVYGLRKQYNSILKILKEVTGQQRQTNDHTQIREKINSRIAQLSKNRQSQVTQ